MLDDYLSALADRASPHTVKGYGDDLRDFDSWFFITNGQMLMPDALTTTDAREYRQHLIQQGARPATVNRRLAALKSFAHYHHIALSVRPVAEQAVAPKWLDGREQAALLREAERGCNVQREHAQRDWAIVTLLLNSGLRVSELCALAAEDVNLAERSGALTVRHGKGDKTRTVPLNLDARKAAAAIIFPLGLTSRSVQRAIEALGRRAGVEVSPHTLRHTFAHNLIERVGLERVAALLGHSKLDTTRRYTTPSAADLRRAVETLD